MDQHEQEVKHILKAVIPTKVEIISLICASFVFLGLSAALDYFQAIDSSSYAQVGANIEITIRDLLSYVDKYIGLTAPTLLFWMLIGTLVYTIIWLAGSTFSAYKDDLPTTKGIMFPRGYKKSNIVHEAVARISMRTAAAILLAGWLYLLFTGIVPSMITTFVTSAESSVHSTIFEAVGSTLILAGSVYIVFVLSRFVLLRDRVFYH